jgi:hypothetical protein
MQLHRPLRERLWCAGDRIFAAHRRRKVGTATASKQQRLQRDSSEQKHKPCPSGNRNRRTGDGLGTRIRVSCSPRLHACRKAASVSGCLAALALTGGQPRGGTQPSQAAAHGHHCSRTHTTIPHSWDTRITHDNDIQQPTSGGGEGSVLPPHAPTPSTVSTHARRAHGRRISNLRGHANQPSVGEREEGGARAVGVEETGDARWGRGGPGRHSTHVRTAAASEEPRNGVGVERLSVGDSYARTNQRGTAMGEGVHALNCRGQVRQCLSLSLRVCRCCRHCRFVSSCVVP